MDRRLFAVVAVLGVLLLLGVAVRADQDKKVDAEDLVGKTAPELPAGATLNGKPVKLDDLKGKVVLVDFWAVWCGPCVSTFPHLRDWNEKYKDKGLEMVGVTTYFEKFGFDKKEGKLTQASEKLSKDDEKDMLKDFGEHHKLKHRLVLVSKDDWKAVCDKYGVTGIPHVVLIDRKGKVQLVKVGSGDENAKALEETIEKLIAEKE